MIVERTVRQSFHDLAAGTHLVKIAGLTEEFEVIAIDVVPIEGSTSTGSSLTSASPPPSSPARSSSTALPAGRAAPDSVDRKQLPE